MRTSERVAKKVESLVRGDEIELVAVDFEKEGSERVLRVFIEKKNGEIDHEDCARISKELSLWLDEEDFIDESYILEVSSPGVERPLRGREDFQRFTGEKVYIKTYAPVRDKKEFTGELKGIEDETVTIFLSEEEQSVSLPLNAIASARLSVDFQLE